MLPHVFTKPGWMICLLPFKFALTSFYFLFCFLVSDSHNLFVKRKGRRRSLWGYTLSTGAVRAGAVAVLSPINLTTDGVYAGYEVWSLDSPMGELERKATVAKAFQSPVNSTVRETDGRELHILDPSIAFFTDYQFRPYVQLFLLFLLAFEI